MLLFFLIDKILYLCKPSETSTGLYKFELPFDLQGILMDHMPPTTNSSFNECIYAVIGEEDEEEGGIL